MAYHKFPDCVAICAMATVVYVDIRATTGTNKRYTYKIRVLCLINIFLNLASVFGPNQFFSRDPVESC